MTEHFPKQKTSREPINRFKHPPINSLVERLASTSLAKFGNQHFWEMFVAKEVKFPNSKSGNSSIFVAILHGLSLADAWFFGGKNPQNDLLRGCFGWNHLRFAKKTLVATLMGTARTFCNLFFVMGTWTFFHVTEVYWRWSGPAWLSWLVPLLAVPWKLSSDYTLTQVIPLLSHESVGRARGPCKQEMVELLCSNNHGFWIWIYQSSFWAQTNAGKRKSEIHVWVNISIYIMYIISSADIGQTCYMLCVRRSRHLQPLL